MLERSPALSSARLPGRLLAVLIGIDAYGRGIPPLRNAVRDVQAVAQVLREAHGYETRLLLDEAATRQGILSQLASLVAEVSADTRLVIYFAGHGLADETVAEGGGPQGFLLPQDASRDDPATLLPMAEIEARLSRLPCQHLLLLLDCCFAGAFRWSKTRSFTPRRSKLYRERFERYLRDPAWQVIASAAADERALDTLLGTQLGGRGAEGENSPFAAALCRALQGAADLRIDGQPGDGVIIGSELHYYLETAFERIEQQVGRTMQKPLLWSIKERDKGQFVFLTPGRSLSLPTALELNEHNDPYRGLASYGEEHRMLFFGRSTVADALTTQVEGHELVVLVGASGTGKSSLVRAGLLPRLRAKSAPAWHIEPPTRPGTTPLAMLGALAGSLCPGSPTLKAAVAGFRQRKPGTPIFLCIDQVEEVVSQAASELPAFLTELSAARQAGGGQLHIVLTLRSDFEPYFAPLWRDPDQAVGAERFLIPPMTRAELREAIEGPASERVLFFEPPSLVDRLLDEVADMPGPLPLLSFVLSEMYRASLRRPLDRTLSDADYQALGGVGGALSQRADAVYSSYADEADRRAFRYLLLRMVVPGELARRRVLDSELTFSDPSIEARVRGMIRRLLSERLLVADRDRAGRDFVEPAHDKLVMGWPQLGRFLAEDTGYLLQHSLSQAAQTWQAASRPRAYLWDRDPLLPQALTTLSREPGRYNRQEEDFIRASQSRRRLGQGGIAALVLVFVAGLLGWLIQERNSSQKIRGQLLASYEERGRQLLLQGDVPRALLWLNRVYQAGGGSDSLRLLLAQATHHRGIAQPPLRPPAGRIRQAHFYPDGSRILTLAGESSPPQVWDARSGELLFALHGHTSEVTEAVFSRDGRYILTIGQDEAVMLWEAQDGVLVDVLASGQGMTHVTMSPDGQRIVSATDGGEVSSFSAQTGELLSTRNGAPGLERLAYSADGSILVSQGSHDLVAWSEAGGAPLNLFHGKRSSNDDFAFVSEPDGLHLLVAGEDRLLWNFRLPPSQIREPQILSADGTSPEDVLLSPGGDRIVYSHEDGSAVLLALPEGSLLAKLPAPADAPRNRLQMSFSGDGARLLLAQEEGVVRVFDRRGQLQGQLAADKLRRAALSLDGSQIVTLAGDREVRVFSSQTFAAVSTLRTSPPAEVSPGGPARQPASPPPAFSDVPVRSFDHHGAIVSLALDPQGEGISILSIQPGWGPMAETEIYPLNGPSEPSVEEARSLSRSRSWIFASALSPDGQTLAAGSWDDRARLFDVASGAVKVWLRGHRGRQRAIAYSRDGRRIVTGSTDHTAKVWDAQSGQLIATHLGHTNNVIYVAMNGDGQRVLSIDEDGQVHAWQAQEGTPLFASTQLAGQFRLAQLDAAGQRMVVGSNEEAQTWHSGQPQSWQHLRAHDVGYLRSISPAATHLVFEKGDQLSLRTAESQTPLPLQPRPAYSPNLVSFSEDGSLIVAAGGDSTATLWETAHGTRLHTLTGHADEVMSARFSPGGQQVVTASKDKTVRLWDVQSGTLLRTLSGHPSAVQDATYSLTGGRILTRGDTDYTLRAFEVETGKLLSAFPGQTFTNLAAAFSPDGSRVLSSDSDGTLKLWDRQGLEHLQTLASQASHVTSVAWSADGHRILATVAESLQIFDPHSNTRRLQIAAEPDQAGLAFVESELSFDGAHIASITKDNTLQVYDGKSGARRWTLPGVQHRITGAKFSPDGRYLLTASPYEGARLYQTASGQLIGELRGHNQRVSTLAYHPQGTQVLTGSIDGVARIFAVPSLKLVHTLSGHRGEIGDAQFSPKYPHVLTASKDGTAMLWDTETGRSLFTWDDVDPRRPLAVFGADGLSIALAGRKNAPAARGASSAKGGAEPAAAYLAHVYRLALEVRSPAEIDDLVRCRVPLRFDGETIVPARRDVQACRRLPQQK